MLPGVPALCSISNPGAPRRLLGCCRYICVRHLFRTGARSEADVRNRRDACMALVFRRLSKALSAMRALSPIDSLAFSISSSSHPPRWSIKSRICYLAVKLFRRAYDRNRGHLCVVQPEESRESRSTTQGKAAPGVEVRIVDPQSGADCANGHSAKSGCAATM